MRALVSSDWLYEHLEDEDLRIFDCRFQLGQPYEGKRKYDQAHIPRALYVDLEQNLSAPVGEHGGRHPLPDMDGFASFLGQKGVTQNDTVIVYDDQGGAMAARMWWMLKYVGHPKVYVLDCTFTHWEHEGKPVTSEVPKFKPEVYLLNKNPQMLVHIEEVKHALNDNRKVLIDARDEKRFKGLEDNVDLVAGRIPGAKHYFWKDVLDHDGKWKAKEDLKKQFKPLLEQPEVISYCGSGVTACVNILAMYEAGMGNARLYAGSWSDWCSYPALPYESDEE